MQSLPLSVILTQQPCLIIGGGRIAYRKAKLLQAAGARINVVAPDIEADLLQLVSQSGGDWLQSHYDETISLTPYRLVIAATSDAAVNAQVFTDGERQGVWVNSVDDIPHCRFMFPAIIDRSPLMISVASNGASPVLSRQLRTQLETLIPQQLGRLAQFAGDWRPQVKARIASPEQRRIFWENLFAGPLREQVFAGQLEQANQTLQQALSDWQTPRGEVYLVGAGPGDPELLTLKALRLMQQADVVFYDRLVSPAILELCRRDAEKIYVGKARAEHAVPQQQINQLLVTYARQGKRVCRLKGGDPFIFGRGGEELEEICQSGIAFQVVPGITAASGCAAYAGIPLTHRDYAQSVRLLTGHLKAGSPELPWSELVYEHQTLVLYMGLVGLADICQQLIAHGQRPDMPVALISRGTTPQQQIVTGTLATIAQQVMDAQLQAPTLTIIGEVVRLRERLGHGETDNTSQGQTGQRSHA